MGKTRPTPNLGKLRSKDRYVEAGSVPDVSPMGVVNNSLFWFQHFAKIICLFQPIPLILLRLKQRIDVGLNLSCWSFLHLHLMIATLACVNCAKLIQKISIAGVQSVNSSRVKVVEQNGLMELL